MNQIIGCILYGFPFTRGPMAAGELVSVRGSHILRSWTRVWIFSLSPLRTFCEDSFWYLPQS